VNQHEEGTRSTNSPEPSERSSPGGRLGCRAARPTEPGQSPPVRVPAVLHVRRLQCHEHADVLAIRS
jgi:hypothetical protein